MFVSLLAPRIFSTFVEWRLGLVVGCLLAAWIVLDREPQSFFRRRFALIAPVLLVAFLGLGHLGRFSGNVDHELFISERNFYGVISIVERNADDPARHSLSLYNGRIIHGMQFVDPDKRREPTTYYGRSSGAGQVLAALGENADARVGVVGLGVATLATYAEPGQYYRFYEINDDVLRSAQKYFTFLADCRGSHDVVLGDGRLSLEREEPQRFDVLILDVFSGDAVPTHLLTEEAFKIYQRHLQPGATIAIHVSNLYLDLVPVVGGLAERFAYVMHRVTSPPDSSRAQLPAEWVVLNPREAQPIEHLTSAADETPGAKIESESKPRTILWTDDYSNLFEILK